MVFPPGTARHSHGVFDKIGNFELRRQVGRGAMGVVYEAWDVRISRRVALKMLRVDRIDAADLPDMLVRFTREATAVARLSLPHIVTIFEFGEWQGSPYLVADTAGLRHAIFRGGWFDPAWGDGGSASWNVPSSRQPGRPPALSA